MRDRLAAPCLSHLKLIEVLAIITGTCIPVFSKWLYLMSCVSNTDFTCPFSRQVWHDILAWLRMTCRPPDRNTSISEWWLAAKAITPKPLRKGLASATLLTGWMIWKQQNACVFEGDQPSVHLLTQKIKAEAALWARARASGLRLVIPSTWDVH